MALKIKKQYKNPDGTLIEVEGTEAEIESFEKKQRKQKQQIEAEEKKKTILYGKDLEAIRKIVQEEIVRAAMFKTTYEYRYIYPPDRYYVPWPQYQPIITWMGTQQPSSWSSDQISIGGGSTNTNGWCGTVSSVNTEKPVTYTVATGSAQWVGTTPTVSVFSSQVATGSGHLDSYSGIISSAGSGWGSTTSNFLMSPRS